MIERPSVPRSTFATVAALSVATLLGGCERRPNDAVPPSKGVIPESPRAVKVNNIDRWNVFRNLHPQGDLLTTELRFRISNLASHEQSAQRKVLDGDDKLSATVLDSLIAINLTYIGKLNELKPAALEILRKRKVENEPFLKVIDDDVAALLANESYLRTLKSSLGSKDIDCKEASTTLLLCALLRFEQTKLPTAQVPLKFVSGLCFDPSYAPNGIGHNWVEFDGEVLDWSIRSNSHMTRLPANSALYVPIVWSEIIYTAATKKAEVTTRVMPLP